MKRYTIRFMDGSYIVVRRYRFYAGEHWFIVLEKGDVMEDPLKLIDDNMTVTYLSYFNIASITEVEVEEKVVKKDGQGKP